MEDWGKLIGDVPCATAILDRFLHLSELIQITGKSYRLRPQYAAAKEPENAQVQPASIDADDGEKNSNTARRSSGGKGIHKEQMQPAPLGTEPAKTD